jgi:hypothetical protein
LNYFIAKELFQVLTLGLAPEDLAHHMAESKCLDLRAFLLVDLSIVNKQKENLFIFIIKFFCKFLEREDFFGEEELLNSLFLPNYGEVVRSSGVERRKLLLDHGSECSNKAFDVLVSTSDTSYSV